jgi:hypothetical protein
MYGDVLQDANESDIEVARATLITAVLALRHLLAHLTEDRLRLLGIDPSNQDDWKKAECILPQKERKRTE